MTVNYTTNLSLGQPVTGTESGTWGDDVNNAVTSYLDIAIAGGLAITITTADVTLTNTQGTSSATNIGSTTAQYAILNISGAKTAARNLILPSSSKSYIINNAGTGGFALTVKGAATTGVTFADGESAGVAWNGSDYVKVASGTKGTNVSVGLDAQMRLTTGTNNTAVGFEANANSNANSNTVVGSGAMKFNAGGGTNTVMGHAAMGGGAGITGDQNVAIGSSSMHSITSGNFNCAVGTTAAYLLTTGSDNVAIGYGALNAVTTASFNTAVGSGALGSTTGANNTGVGYFALGTTNTGSNNTAVGYSASSQNTTGIRNTAIGYESLFTGSTGGYNIGIGYQAGYDITTGSANIIIGGLNNTGAKVPAFSITTQSNYISMGSTSVTNAYIQVAWTVVSDARDKTDFADVPHGLDFVSKLQPTAYRFKETRDATEGHGPVRYGFKAQDVLALEGDTPVIVDADNPEKLYFNDQSMIAVLVKAIQELKAEFDAYKLTHP